MAKKQTEEKDPAPKSNALIWFVVFAFAVSVLAFGAYRFMKNAEVSEFESDLVVEQKINVAEPVFTKREMKIGARKKQNLESEEDEEDLQDEFEKDAQDEDGEEEIAESIDASLQQYSDEELKKLVAELNQKDVESIAALQAQNDALVEFLAAESLKNLVEREDFANFEKELKFLKQAMQDDLEFEGKISLLEYSAQTEIFTIKKLQQDLGKINLEIAGAEKKTFWQNLQKSIFELVKVTKLDETSEQAYPKILLAKEALEKRDLNEAIRLVGSVKNADTKEWLEKAHKLQRIEETVQYLVDNTRKKLVQ